jgi:hypothetical protein
MRRSPRGLPDAIVVLQSGRGRIEPGGRGGPGADAARLGVAAPLPAIRRHGSAPWSASALVHSPAGVDGPLPTVLSINGGPGGSWGPLPWLPDLALVDHGYRVLRPDPRGSGSYGRAWLEAIAGAWGGADAEDQLAVCDWAVDQCLADPERLAGFGLSYGGFMTSWLIGQTDRFRAAVSANGVSAGGAAANCDLGAGRRGSAGSGLPTASSAWGAVAARVRRPHHTPLLLLQGRPTCAAHPPTTTALQRAGLADARSSTCCIPSPT